MSDGFSELIDRSNVFFEDLAANNTRDWYEAHKSEYVDDIRNPAALMADLLADDLSRMTGTSLKPKLFRIHRDIRFSKDKTPYSPRLHMSWSDTAEPDGPVFFFGSSPSYLIVGTGVRAFSGPNLAAFRARIDRDGNTLSDALAQAATSVGATLSDFGPDPLKRVPKPYDADHQHADLLRRKSLIVTAPPDSGWRKDGLLPAIQSTARALLPIWNWTRAATS